MLPIVLFEPDIPTDVSPQGLVAIHGHMLTRQWRLGQDTHQIFRRMGITDRVGNVFGRQHHITRLHRIGLLADHARTRAFNEIENLI